MRADPVSQPAGEAKRFGPGEQGQRRAGTPAAKLTRQRGEQQEGRAQALQKGPRGTEERQGQTPPRPGEPTLSRSATGTKRGSQRPDQRCPTHGRGVKTHKSLA